MTKIDSNYFSKKTVEILSKRASQMCSKCKRNTSGGNSDPNKVVLIGEAAHIEGAKKSNRRIVKRPFS